MSLTVYTVGLMKAQVGFVEDFSSQQTETTVSNKNKCITKITSNQTSIPRFAKLQSEINTITRLNQHKLFYLCRIQLPTTGTK